MSKTALYILLLIWILLSVFALSQDSWIVASGCGALSLIIGILVTAAGPGTTGLKRGSHILTGILVSLAGIGLIAYALIDRFWIGWRPGN